MLVLHCVKSLVSGTSVGLVARTWTLVLCIVAQEGSHFTLPSLQSSLTGSRRLCKTESALLLPPFLPGPAWLRRAIAGSRSVMPLASEGWGLILWIGHLHGRIPSVSVPPVPPHIIKTFRSSIPFLLAFWKWKCVKPQKQHNSPTLW